VADLLFFFVTERFASQNVFAHTRGKIALNTGGNFGIGDVQRSNEFGEFVEVLHRNRF
jgi:hypothetical protein